MQSIYHYPTKVFIEEKGYQNLFQIMPNNVKKLVVITGRNALQKVGVIDDIQNISKKHDCFLHIVEGVSSNPTNTMVDSIYSECLEFQPDFIVGIGGGSVLDVTKIVSMLITNGGNSWEYINTSERKGKKITKDALPFMLIPTTSGTASESTPFAVITHAETKMKKGMGSHQLYPVACVLDPYLLSLMPQELVAKTGFDAFGQALEGFTSKNSTFHSEHFAKESLRLIASSFESAWKEPKDYKLKTSMAWGALLSGLSIGLVDVNLAHALSHPLSGHFSMHHGLAVCLCTVPAIQFNADVLEDKYIEVAKIMDLKSKSITGLIDQIHRWMDLFCIKHTLKEQNIISVNCDKLADDAIQIGAINTNMKLVKKEDIICLYDQIKG